MKLQNPLICKTIDLEARTLFFGVYQLVPDKIAYQVVVTIVRDQNVWMHGSSSVKDWDGNPVDEETEEYILSLFFDVIDATLIWKGEPTLAPNQERYDTSDGEDLGIP